jgi:hypothetical protein
MNQKYKKYKSKYLILKNSLWNQTGAGTIKTNDFNVDKYIYSNDLAIAYINIFKPKPIKIKMTDDIIKQNIVKKEWFNINFKNGVSISDVINYPLKYSDHYQRMLNADMKFPIIIWKEAGLVIDGNHRLGHAIINNYSYIYAYIFTDDLMEKIKIGTFKSDYEYEMVINKYTIYDYIELFNTKFININ